MVNIKISLGSNNSVKLIDKLIGVYVDTERSICVNCVGGKPTQSAKDGQRDTMHNTLRDSFK